MTPNVLNAIAKWPDVPACYGWLALDARGVWRLRNGYAQQHGLPGDKVTHAGIVEFLQRHYRCDDNGSWYVQNGPQRVFVELAYTPWVVRLVPATDGLRLVTTTGAAFSPAQCLQDEQGRVLIAGTIDGSATIALLHDHDLGLFAEGFETAACGCGTGGRWTYAGRGFDVEPIASAEVARRFGFVANPVSQP